MYNNLLLDNHLNDNLSKFKKIEKSIIKKLQSTYTGLPEDYLLFLEEIGYGELKNASYMMYSGLIQLNEVFDEATAENFKGILIFGDDFQGNVFGFDTENSWVIVEIDSADMSLNIISGSFFNFIQEKLKEI